MSENTEKKVVDPKNEQGDCGSVEEPSAVIEEESGRFSAAIARDGITNSIFGACTDADVD